MKNIDVIDLLSLVKQLPFTAVRWVRIPLQFLLFLGFGVDPYLIRIELRLRNGM
jgi:hypothetical protein